MASQRSDIYNACTYSLGPWSTAGLVINPLSPYRKYCFVVLIYSCLISTTTRDFIWERFMSPVVSVGILKIQVLAKVVVEGIPQQTKAPACQSLHIRPTYLPSRAAEWKPRMLPLSLFSESQTAFYFSINRCHLVSKVCKYSPQFLRNSAVSQTKNNQFLLRKDKGHKNSNRQFSGWVSKAKAEFARQFRTWLWVESKSLGPTLAPTHHSPVVWPRASRLTLLMASVKWKESTSSV